MGREEKAVQRVRKLVPLNTFSTSRTGYGKIRFLSSKLTGYLVLFSLQRRGDFSLKGTGCLLSLRSFTGGEGERSETELPVRLRLESGFGSHTWRGRFGRRLKGTDACI